MSEPVVAGDVVTPRSPRNGSVDRTAWLRSVREPPLPGVLGTVRVATLELWFHPWPCLVANLLWAAAVLALFVLALVWPFGGLVAAPLLALPVAGLYRVAGRIARGEGVATDDAPGAWRSHGRRALGLGILALVGLLVPAVDIVVGVAALGGPTGWVLATASAWALVAVWVVLLHVWPVLLDPRTTRGVRDALRLALAVIATFPGRAIRLTIVTTVVLVAATLLFAALATFAVAWVALLGAFVVLPAADRLIDASPSRIATEDRG